MTAAPKMIPWEGALPACNVDSCKRPALFDTPSIFGCWMNTCSDHVTTHGKNIEIGYQRVRSQ